MIHRVYSFLFSKRSLFLLLILFGVFYLATFINRFIQTDENWFGEEAYWLLTEGTVKLKTMPLTLSFDQRVFVYYKLFVFAGAALIKLFGWSVWPLKIFIFAIYIFFLWLYRKWLSNQFKFDSWQTLLAVFFIVTTPIMVEQTFIFRPEIPMMLLIFVSFIFLYQGIKGNNHYKAMYAGFFAGLSFLVHLNGNVVLIAGFVFLLSYRKYKALVYYCIAAAPVCLVYFFDLTDAASLNAFVYQLKHWPIDDFKETHGVGGFLFQKLTVLLSEHQRFFWSDRVYVLSLLFLFSMVFTFRQLKYWFPELLRYFLVLIICLNLFGGFIAQRYLIYYMPFMAFIIAFSVHYHLTRPSKAFKWIIVVLVVLQTGFLVKYFNWVYHVNYNHDMVHARVLEAVPEKGKTLAPWEFIYNGIPNYQLYSYKNVEYYRMRKLTVEEFSEVLEKLNVDHIIFSKELGDLVQFDPLNVSKDGIFNYVPVYRNSGFVVLRKTPANVGGYK